MISTPPRMVIQQSMERIPSFYHASATTPLANHSDFFNTHACSQQLSDVNSVFAPHSALRPHAINLTNRLVTILAPISNPVAEKHHPGETGPPETCESPSVRVAMSLLTR